MRACISCIMFIRFTKPQTDEQPFGPLVFRHQKGDGLFPETGLNLAEIFILCGFFLIYAVEEFTQLVLKKYSADKAGRNKPVS